MTELNTDPLHDGGATGQRGPLAPRVMIAVLDRVLRTQPAAVLDLRVETPTIVSLRLQRPPPFPPEKSS